MVRMFYKYWGNGKPDPVFLWGKMLLRQKYCWVELSGKGKQMRDLRKQKGSLSSPSPASS